MPARDRGRLAVIPSTRDLEMGGRVVDSADMEGLHGAGRLTRPVAAYLATEVKGLEFDSVIVVDPTAIEDECGWRQLYVVLTRPTTHLGMIIAGDLGDVGQQWLDTGTVTSM